MQKAGLDGHTDNDRVSRVENVFGVDAQFARKDGEVLELVALLQQPLLAELGEPVEQVVDDVGDEDVDAETVGHLLRLSLHFHVEGHYHSVSTSRTAKHALVAVSLVTIITGHWQTAVV